MTIPTLLLVGLALGEITSWQAAPPADQFRPAGSPSQKDPYGTLFQTAPSTETPDAQDLADRARAQLFAAIGDASRPARPKVVCGTLVFPADASIDPRILIDPTARAGGTTPAPNHTIRSLQPPVCGAQ
jgi:hypothetical protein